MSFFYCPKIFIKTIDTVGDNDYYINTDRR